MVVFRNGVGVNTTKGANVMGVTLGRDGGYKCPFGAMVEHLLFVKHELFQALVTADTLDQQGSITLADDLLKLVNNLLQGCTPILQVLHRNG